MSMTRRAHTSLMIGQIVASMTCCRDARAQVLEECTECITVRAAVPPGFGGCHEHARRAKLYCLKITRLEYVLDVVILGRRVLKVGTLVLIT